jgi:large subunit ribosomal protein L10
LDNPRPEKVAVVDEVRERLSGASAALLTEYRGLDVAAMAQLRRNLRQAGGEMKVYKNTLVRFAARDLGLDVEDLLTGPTAIAFVDGDPVNVAKALRDFARTNPALVVKGGLLGTRSMTAAETQALADVEPREVLLAKLAGALQAPMQQFAGLLQALPQNLAYGLKALLDQRGGAPEEAATDEPAAEAAAAEPATDSEAAAEPAAEPATDTDTPTDTEPPAEETPAATPAEES